jgi:hypothetical protein
MSHLISNWFSSGQIKIEFYQFDFFKNQIKLNSDLNLSGGFLESDPILAAVLLNPYLATWHFM